MIDLRHPAAWKGVWTALVTPLTKTSSGILSLDAKSLENLIEDQIANGITGFAIAGSTGEGSLLSSESYEELLKLAAAIVANRVPLIAGLGIGGTSQCLKNLGLALRYGYSAAL